MTLSRTSMPFCMSATPFTADNKLDEAGFRAHLRRMVGHGLGVYLASPGSGEGHALTDEELSRVYTIGVEECRGKVPTFANLPESRTAAQMQRRLKIARDAGVDVIQVYGLDAGHGMHPNVTEQEHYYRTVLDGVDYPLSLSVHVFAGYVPPVALIKKMCDEYKSIVAVNVMGTSTTYLVEMMEAIGPRLAYYTSIRHLAEGLGLGTQGSLLGQANLVPRLCRAVYDRYNAGDLKGYNEAFSLFMRFNAVLERWGSNPRWIKMGMKILDLPGSGGGRLREPYVLPSEADHQELAKAIDRLGIRQFEGL